MDLILKFMLRKLHFKFSKIQMIFLENLDLDNDLDKDLCDSNSFLLLFRAGKKSLEQGVLITAPLFLEIPTKTKLSEAKLLQRLSLKLIAAIYKKRNYWSEKRRTKIFLQCTQEKKGKSLVFFKKKAKWRLWQHLCFHLCPVVWDIDGGWKGENRISRGADAQSCCNRSGLPDSLLQYTTKGRYSTRDRFAIRYMSTLTICRICDWRFSVSFVIVRCCSRRLQIEMEISTKNDHFCRQGSCLFFLSATFLYRYCTPYLKSSRVLSKNLSEAEKVDKITTFTECCNVVFSPQIFLQYNNGCPHSCTHGEEFVGEDSTKCRRNLSEGF